MFLTQFSCNNCFILTGSIMLIMSWLMTILYHLWVARNDGVCFGLLEAVLFNQSDPIWVFIDGYCFVTFVIDNYLF